MKRKKYIVVGIVLLLIIIFAGVITYSKCIVPDFKTQNIYGLKGKVILSVDNDAGIFIYGKENTDYINKIYYVKRQGKYLYAIDKWNRYFVIDIWKVEIVIDTYDYSNIENKHKKIFGDISSFKDIRNWNMDADEFYGVVAFGDKTIYLKVNDNKIYCYSEREGKTGGDKIIDEAIEKYFFYENTLYLIDENTDYYVINVEEYCIIYESKKAKTIDDEYERIFSQIDKFNDIYDIIN